MGAKADYPLDLMYLYPHENGLITNRLAVHFLDHEYASSLVLLLHVDVQVLDLRE